MADDSESERLADAWWSAWLQADYSWEGLRNHPIAGDGGTDGQVTLQDYWRQTPENSQDRTDEEMEAAGELERGFDGRLWHIAHLPVRWPDGAKTWKASRAGNGWTRLERIVRRRLEVAIETEVDEQFYESGIEGDDGRAQLQGCVLKRVPWIRNVGEKTHILADQAAFLHPVFQMGDELGRGASFKRALFEGRVLFNRTKFANASFERAVFLKAAHFRDVQFRGDVSFVSADFQETTFNNSDFAKIADFFGCRFRGDASFARAEFAGRCMFSSAKFLGDASFSGAGFGGDSIFADVTFSGLADFSGAPAADRSPGQATAIRLTFDRRITDLEGVQRILEGELVPPGIDGPLKRRSFRRAMFAGAQFHKGADFSNRTFLARSDFSHARFCDVAKFHDSKLHQDTSFASSQFKIAPFSGSSRSVNPLGKNKLSLDESRNAHFEEYERAFRTLKLAMEGQRARREEARFYRRELEARRMRPSMRSPHGGSKEVTWLEKGFSIAYEAASDYGESLGRPLIWLFALWLLFATAYAAMAGELKFSCWLWESRCEVTSAVSLAAERTWLPFLAQSSGLAEWARASGVGSDLTGALAGIVHRVLATLLIFLVALAARRKFQIS